MKHSTLGIELLKLIDRERRKRGPRVDDAYITSRNVSGAAQPTYNAIRNGDAVGGLTAASGDYEPGQTVVIHQFGEYGDLHSIAHKAKPELRGTQPPQVWERDVTDDELL